MLKLGTFDGWRGFHGPVVWFKPRSRWDPVVCHGTFFTISTTEVPSVNLL